MVYLKQKLTFAILLVLAFGFSQKSPAQSTSTPPVEMELNKQRHLYQGIGTTYFYGRDQGMSPLIYKGPLFQMQTGYSNINQKRIHNGYLRAGAGRILSQNDASAATAISVEFGYSFLKNVTASREDFALYIGGDFSVLGNVRLHSRYQNGFANYEGLISLSPVAELRKPVQFNNRTVTAGFGVKLPVANLLFRPAYVSSIPPGFQNFSLTYDEALVKSLFPTTLNDVIRVKTNLYLHYPFRNGNAIRLAYSWDFYRIDHIPENKVIAGYHLLTTFLYFNL